MSRFDHQCYTDEEALNVVKSRKAVEPAVYGGRTFAAWASLYAKVLHVFAFLGFMASASPYGLPVLPAVILLVLGAVAFIVSVLAYEAPHDNDDLQKLSVSELAQVADIGDQYSAIKQAVSHWLAERKCLRKRDLWAIRAHANREAEQAKHVATMERLRTPPTL